MRSLRREREIPLRILNGDMDENNAGQSPHQGELKSDGSSAVLAGGGADSPSFQHAGGKRTAHYVTSVLLWAK